MSNTTRQKSILDVMRSGSVYTAGTLAKLFGASERTIYRDIARLRADGVTIIGEIGVGFVWRTQPMEENDG